MKDLLVVVDVYSINKAIQRDKSDTRLDYRAYLNHAKQDDILLRALAYGYNTRKEIVTFKDCLQRYGYQVYLRDIFQSQKNPHKIIYIPNHVRVALDVMEIIHQGKVNKVVLGANDPNYIDLVQHLKSKGIEVEIFCNNVPNALRNAASTCRDFTDELLLTGIIVDGKKAE